MPEPSAGRPTLTILVAGCISAGDLGTLPELGTIEVIDLGIARDADFRAHGAEINRTLGGAASDWILFLRGRESVPAGLAAEIGQVTREPARAWGYRIRTETFYAGEPLRISAPDDGEIRLIHRRHGRFDLKRSELKVEGAVVRLQQCLRAATFDSCYEHVAFLQKNAREVSGVKRVIRFVSMMLRNGGMFAGGATRKYLWIEAGYE